MAIAASNTLIMLLLAVPGLGFLLTPVFRKRGSSWVKIGSAATYSGNEPRKATFKYTSHAGYTQRQKNGFAWIVPSVDDGDDLTAFSAVCSHTGCNVAWHSEEECFVCPCHAGRYDLQGNVISGPPPRPLTRLPLKLENGNLVIQIPT